jgi:hypothetical protein
LTLFILMVVCATAYAEKLEQPKMMEFTNFM